MFGIGADVDPEGPPAKVSYIVQRGIDVEDRSKASSAIAAMRKRTSQLSLFYRGHTFPAREPCNVNVVLEPVNEVVMSRCAKIVDVAKGFRDQFRVHPQMDTCITMRILITK